LKLTDRRTDRQTDGRTDGWTDGRRVGRDNIAFKNKSHTVRRTQLLFFILVYDIAYYGVS